MPHRSKYGRVFLIEEPVKMVLTIFLNKKQDFTQSASILLAKLERMCPAHNI